MTNLNKSLIAVALAAAFITGCATMSAQPGNQRKSDASSFDTPASPFPAPSLFPPPPPQMNTWPQMNTGPQLVLPVTGGAPVTAIPLGGSLYLPVTGGGPVVGIPLSP